MVRYVGMVSRQVELVLFVMFVLQILSPLDSFLLRSVAIAGGSCVRSRHEELLYKRLYMGKAEREKKKKKAVEKRTVASRGSGTLSPSSSPLSSPSSSPTPWRVSGGTHMKNPTTGKQRRIPVKVQIAWAKAYKRLKSNENKKNVVNTKRWRQENVKKEEEEYVEIDYERTRPPAVFVDGYNIIGFMKVAENRDDVSLEDARDCLVSDLGVLQGSTGWYIEVVFDAYAARGVEHLSRSQLVDGVMVTFTSKSETADNHIERRFSELRKEGYSNMIVATDDNVLRMVAGDQGAGYLSAYLLVEEFRLAYRGWEILQEELETVQARHKPSLKDGLPEDMKAAIAKMKTDAAASDSPKKFVVKKMQTKAQKSQVEATVLSRSGLDRYEEIYRINQQQEQR